MKIIEKIFVAFLILSLLNLYLPRLTFSQVGDIQEEITKHPPEMRSTPEENIPVEVVKKGLANWVWVALGLLVIGGALTLVATQSGGGGGGGGGGSSASTATTTASSNSSRGNSGGVAVGW